MNLPSWIAFEDERREHGALSLRLRIRRWHPALWWFLACILYGVLHSYARGWTGPVPLDAPLPQSVEFVTAPLDHCFEVVVLTTRARTPKLTSGFERDLGGWCRSAIVDRLCEALDASPEAEQPRTAEARP